MKTMIRTVALVAAIALASAPANAGTEAILARGFEPNSVHHVNEFDSVNTLNGDLKVSIPIGPVYKTNGSLEYQFSLYHFDNAWAFFDYYGVDGAPSEVKFLYSWSSGGYQYTVFDLDSPSSAGYLASEAVPVGNVGMGWSIDIGSFTASPVDEVFPQGGYSAPDGTGYGFGATIHSATAAPDTDVAYTQNSTYLRMRVVSKTPPVREVDLPNGIVKRFQCVARCDKWNADWQLQWTADPFGNVLRVTRQPELRPSSGPWIWTIEEGTVAGGETRPNPYYAGEPIQVVRTHRLHFSIDPKFSSHPILGERLTKAELAGPNGDASMVYTFTYTDTNILRTPVRPWTKEGLLIPYNNDKTITTDLLTSITLPANGGKWSFEYYNGKVIETSPGVFAPDVEANVSYTFCSDASAPSTGCPEAAKYPTNKRSGRLFRVKAPTGGGYQYAYEPRVFPKRNCLGQKFTDKGFGGGGATLGVKSRKEIDSGNHVVKRDGLDAVWRYSGNSYYLRFIDENGDGCDDADVSSNPATTCNGVHDLGEPLVCRAPKEFLAAVLEPNGRMTLNYFNADYGKPEYGAPFSPWASRANTVTRENGTPVTRNLSSEIYAVDITRDASDPEDPPFLVDLNDAVRRLTKNYRNQGEPGTENQVTLLRGTYVSYEWSGFQCVDDDLPIKDCTPLNLRLQSQHSRFYDDTLSAPGGERPFTESIWSDFDGLGHYRQQNIYGNFSVVGRPNCAGCPWDHRIEYTYYNPSVEFTGQARPAPGNGMPLPASPWLLETYSRTSSIEKKSNATGKAEGAINTTLYLFDARRGHLRGFRKLADTGVTPSVPAPALVPQLARDLVAPMGGTDLLARFSRGNATSGNGKPQSIVTEENYGGDIVQGENELPLTFNALPDGSVDVGSASRDYLIESTLEQGTLVGTDYKCNPQTSVFARTFMAVLAPEMRIGLPQFIADESGLQTEYTYDGLGRVTSVKPPGGLTPQSYAYQSKTAPVNGGMNSLELKRGTDQEISQGVGSTLKYVFDDLGRLLTESSLVPTGTALNTASTAYEYTVTNAIRKKTLPLGGSIRYLYDPFDRPVKVTNADGKITDTDYLGTRESTSRRKIAFGSVGQPVLDNAQLTRKSDSFGRLIVVNDGVTRAEYGYDAGSRLTTIDLAVAFGNGAPQRREFVYDGRGAVKTAIHPELKKPGATSGAVLKTEVDARGHVILTDLKQASGASLDKWTLRYGYDAAERLRTVARQGSAGYLPLQNFTYYDTTDAYGLRNRMKSATRHNYFPAPLKTDELESVDVTTTMTYVNCPANASATAATACTGLPFDTVTSAAEIRGDGAPQSVFTGRVVYGHDVRGNLSRIDYLPFGTIGPTRSIHYGYKHDILTSVKEGSAQRALISYQLNGLPNEIQLAAPGVKNTIASSEGGLPRIGGITWEWKTNAGQKQTVNSGSFVYDGAGNIMRILSPTAAEAYTYDAGSRVKTAQIGSASETYSYDPYGNLIDFNGRALTTDGPSNRMTIAGVTYDDAGNITALPGLTLRFDALNTVTQVESPAFRRAFVYDANNERIGVIHYGGTRRELWSVRDTGNRILRDFERTYDAGGASVWSWKKDYIYRGSTLSNSIGSNGDVRDIHVDHLGSVRYVTNGQGKLVGAGATTAGNRFLPFGSLAFERTLDERIAFTGHERDDDGTSSDDLDLDYMHARYYAPAFGRFLSLDPAPESAAMETPQTWNRFAYARNNPVRFTDPDGRVALVDDAVIGITVGTVLLGTYLQAPSVVPGKTNGRVLTESAVEGFQAIGTWLMNGQGGGGDEMAAQNWVRNWAANKEKEADLPALPDRDATGKVHGELPTLVDLRKYPTDELRHFQDELKGSVGRRVDVTSKLGPDKAHGERQSAEQRLIKQIDKVLADRKDE